MALLEQHTSPTISVCCMDPSGWLDTNDALSACYGYDSAGAAVNAAAMLHAQFDLWPPFSSDCLPSGDEGSADPDDMERQDRMLPVHWAMDQDHEGGASAAQAIQANDLTVQDVRFERCFQRPLAPNNDSKAVAELQIAQQNRHCLGLAPHCDVAFTQKNEGPTDAGMLSSWYKRWLVLDFALGSLTIYRQKDQQTLDLRTVRAIKRTSRLELSIDFVDAAQSSLPLRYQAPSQAELWVTLLLLAQQLVGQAQSVDLELTTPSSDNSTMEHAADASDEAVVSRQLMKLQLETTAACT